MTEPTTYRMGTNQKIAVGSASAQSAVMGTQTRVVRIKVTTDTWIAQGASPTAAATTGNGWLMMAGDTEYVKCTPGEKFAFIRDSADGSVSLVECDR